MEHAPFLTLLPQISSARLGCRSEIHALQNRRIQYGSQYVEALEALVDTVT